MHVSHVRGANGGGMSTLSGAIKDVAYAKTLIARGSDRDRHGALGALQRALETSVRSVIAEDPEAAAIAKRISPDGNLDGDYQLRNTFIAILAKHRGFSVNLREIDLLRQRRNKGTHERPELVPSEEYLERAVDVVTGIIEIIAKREIGDEIATIETTAAYERVPPPLYPMAAVRACCNLERTVSLATDLFDVSHNELSDIEFIEEFSVLAGLNTGTALAGNDVKAVIGFGHALRKVPLGSFSLEEVGDITRALARIRKTLHGVSTIALRQRLLAADVELHPAIIGVYLSIEQNDVVLRIRYDDIDERRIVMNAIDDVVLVNSMRADILKKRYRLEEADLHEVGFHAEFGIVENRALFFENLEYLHYLGHVEFDRLPTEEESGA